MRGNIVSQFQYILSSLAYQIWGFKATDIPLQHGGGISPHAARPKPRKNVNNTDKSIIDFINYFVETLKCLIISSLIPN